MSRKKRRETPEWQWEQALIDDYYDHRWRQVLDPLYEKFQRWAAGELTHDDMDQAIHETHKENQGLYSLFTQSREFLVRMIQWDEKWFREWVTDHPPPEGVQLASLWPFASTNDQETAPSDDDEENDG
ncbi:MAG: hypothetical protein JW934_19480 [Anaerolineae bacterium]|nr:hypothetical protein [Anaerolineae bacterium]